MHHLILFILGEEPEVVAAEGVTAEEVTAEAVAAEAVAADGVTADGVTADSVAAVVRTGKNFGMFLNNLSCE